MKAGDLKVLKEALERREARDNSFALSWDTTARLEDCYYTVRTKKDYIAKGKREGIHALIQDSNCSSESVWWKSMGL